MKNALSTATLGIIFALITGAALAQEEIPRQSILMTCDGDPPLVSFVQKSFGAPNVEIDTPCADAISFILSTPFPDPNKDWDIKVTIGDRKFVNYLFVEILRIPGPQGPQGAKGDMGDPGIGGTRPIFLRQAPNTAQLIDNTPNRIVLTANNAGQGPFAAHIIVEYDSKGNEGTISCTSGPIGSGIEVTRTAVVPPARGRIEFGNPELLPTGVTGSEITQLTGQLPFIATITQVVCHAEVNGDGQAIVFPVGTFLPVSVLPAVNF